MNPNHAHRPANSHRPGAPLAVAGGRILVLQTIRANRLREFAAVCAKVRELAPGCSIAAVVTPEIQGPVAALGCAQQLLLPVGGHWALLRQVRAARFDKVCIANDGGGMPGQIRDDILALAARPRQLFWCAPGGEVRTLSTARLALRVMGEGVLVVMVFGVAAALAMLVAAALLGAGIVGGLRHPSPAR